MLNLFLNKNFFQSFKKYFFIFLILLNFLFIFNLNKSSISFAQNSSNKATTELIEKSEKNLQSVSDGKNGLIGCDAQDCGLDDLFALFKKIVLILITLIVISAFVLVIYYSILYYNKGDDANFLKDIKAKIEKVFWGLVLVLGSLAIVIGVLQAFGADKSIIMNVKKIFSQTDVSIFPKAFAAETSTSGTSYPTIVGGSIIKIIITALKVVLNYVVSPILIGYIFMTGILFVKAQGDSKELEEAKKKAKRLSIILLITLIAPVLLNVVLGTLTEVVKDVNDSVKVEKKKEVDPPVQAPSTPKPNPATPSPITDENINNLKNWNMEKITDFNKKIYYRVTELGLISDTWEKINQKNDIIDIINSNSFDKNSSNLFCVAPLYKGNFIRKYTNNSWIKDYTLALQVCDRELKNFNLINSYEPIFKSNIDDFKSSLKNTTLNSQLIFLGGDNNDYNLTDALFILAYKKK